MVRHLKLNMHKSINNCSLYTDIAWSLDPVMSYTSHYPFPKRQILDCSKLKEFSGNNFKFDENGSKFSKREENPMEDGEIAGYEHFLLFPQCFQKTRTADM